MYEVTTDEQSRARIDALPAAALAPFAEARAVLELAPWNGRPYHRHRPDSPMRTLVFGPHGEGHDRLSGPGGSGGGSACSWCSGWPDPALPHPRVAGAYSSSGAKSLPQAPQVIGPAASTAGATRIRRPQSHTHGGGDFFLPVVPPSPASAERCSRSAAPS